MPSPGRTAMSKVVFVAMWLRGSFSLRPLQGRGASNRPGFWYTDAAAADYNPTGVSTTRKGEPTMFRRALCALPLLLAAAWFAARAAHAADWPHWLGPNYNGSSPETGLLVTWPSEGPKVLWKAPGGPGYSSIAVANKRAITLVQRDKQEWVLALDAASGKELWKTPISAAYKNQFGDGPRSTPTIEGKFVYVQSVNGPVVCLDADKGDIIWKTDLFKVFKTKNITWGLSASPLIDGDLIF